MSAARGLTYYLVYFVIFTGLAALLRTPLAASGVSEYGLPVIVSGLMTLFFLPMALHLTVIRPEPPFAFKPKAKRWLRFLVWAELFLLVSVLLPFFPALRGSSLTWLAGIMPLFMFLFMVQPLRAQVRLASRPGRDSRWRAVKFWALYFLLQAVPAVGLVGYWLALPETERSPKAMALAMYIFAAAAYLLLFLVLYRIVVARPHSRFDAMPGKARWKRLGGYLLTYCCFELLGPLAIRTFWRWDVHFNYSFLLVLGLLHCAAFGTDAIPSTRPEAVEPPAPREAPDSAIKRRLAELSRRYPA